MKKVAPPGLESLRQVHPTMGRSPVGAMFGFFVLGPLRIISSGTPAFQDASIWEHVSISLANRCPTWDEMCRVKDLFWSETETVVQFHPKRSEYVNAHPYCLHLWKMVGKEYNLPPEWTLGPKGASK